MYVQDEFNACLLRRLFLQPAPGTRPSVEGRSRKSQRVAVVNEKQANGVGSQARNKLLVNTCAVLFSPMDLQLRDVLPRVLVASNLRV